MNNIIFKVTKKYMARNRRRTAVAFMGIVFMVIMMTCVFIGKNSVLQYLDRVASLKRGSWHVSVFGLRTGETEKLAQMDTVESVGFSEQLSNLEFPQSGNPDFTPFIDVKAYSAECFALANIRLTEGRFPENSHELLLSDSAIQEGAAVGIGDKISGAFFERTITGIKEGATTVFPFSGIELHCGETVTVPIGFMAYDPTDNDSYREDRVFTGIAGDYTVVGIMESPAYEKRGGASYAALTFLEKPCTNQLNALVRINTEKVRSISDFEQDVAAFAADGITFETNELLLTFSALSGDSNINAIVIVLEIFFTLFIMAASMILIYNVFNMSFAERTKYLGILSSVGATRRQKRQSIFYESFRLFLPALPSGIILGMGAVFAVLKLLKPRFDAMLSIVQPGMQAQVPVSLAFGVKEISIIIVMCLLTVLFSALIPAIKVSKIAPVESVRGMAENAGSKRFRTRKNLLAQGKPEMLLAVNTTARSRHLTKSIVRSIAVFAVLTVVTLYGAGSFITIARLKTDEGGWYPVYPDCNQFLYVRQNTPSCDMLRDVLAKEPGITGCKEITESTAEVTINSAYLSDSYMDAYKAAFMQFDSHTEADWDAFLRKSKDIVFINTITLEDADFADLSAKCGAEIYDSSVPAALLYNSCYFNTDQYSFGNECSGYQFFPVESPFNVPQGGDLPISECGNSDTEIMVKAAGFLDDAALEGSFILKADCPYVFLNQAAHRALLDQTDAAFYTYFMVAADDVTVSKLEDLINVTANDPDAEPIGMGTCTGYDTPDSFKQVITEIVRILAYCFIALISAVCLLNLYNSIRGRAAERTKETAILRSMGMTDKQFTRMFDLENLMLLGKGFAIAAVICTVLCLLLRYSIVRYFGAVSLPMPRHIPLLTAAAIAAASSLMTRLCTRRRKADIIEDIRRETV